MDYEVQRFSRHCAVTGRELAPGETFYSALIPSGATVSRQDYCAAAWHGPPENSLGWWKSQVPAADAKKPQWAPNDAMLQLFDELADQSDSADMRYVLTLLLIRRRVLRLEETEKNGANEEMLVVSCPRRQADYRIAVVMPEPARAAAIQQMFAQLLLRNAA